MSNWPLGVISSAGGGASGFGLYSWGLNSSGELGHGGTTSVSSPVQIGTDEDWVNAQCGMFYTIAIRNNGTLWGFGKNNVGQLGDNSTTVRSSPVQIGSDEDWLDAVLSPNQYNCSVVKADGTLWTWGSGAFGRNGLGNTSTVCVPTQVGSETGWADCGGHGQGGAFIKQNGTLWTVGRGHAGALANGNSANATSNNYSTPVQVGSLTNWKFLHGKFRGMFCVKTDGTLWTWGEDDDGANGDGGGDVTRSSPIQIGSDTNWKEPFGCSGNTGGCLKTNGELYGWGNVTGGGWANFEQGTPTTALSPDIYENEPGGGGDTDWQGDHRIRGNTGGGNGHNGTVKSSGNKLYMWGNNEAGELGNGNTTRINSPIQIAGSWYRVGTGVKHTVGLK